MAHTKIGRGWIVLVLTGLAFSLPGCAARDIPAAGTYEGPSTAVGAGRAHAFVAIGDDGRPATIGIRLTEAALTGLPVEPPHDVPGWEYTVPMPRQAAVSGYRHIVVNWNPKGHVPPGVYDAPHFDFHFYLISPEQRARITAVGADRIRAQKQPEPDYMPAGYQLPEGTAEPRMGAHAIDPTAPEFHQRAFAQTFIYGFYDGHMIFLEPMVSKAFLETKPNTSATVKLPRKYDRRAFYPTRYSVTYDKATRAYTIALEGLKSSG